METGKLSTAFKVNEPTTSGSDEIISNHILNQADIETNGPSIDRKVSCEGKPDEGVRNLQNVSFIYRQDVVKSNAGGETGIVTEVAGDSDSDSSITDDESEDDDDNDEDESGDGANEVDEEDGNENGDRIRGGDGDKNGLPADQIRVIWMDASATTESINDVTVVDRGFLHGDYVAAASNPSGQVGLVVDVNISVDLLSPDGRAVQNVSSKDLKRVRDFTVGDYVVLGPWLGRIDDVLDNVTVLFDDGSVCKVMKADPLRLKPIGKNILEDGHFPYYPGQRVKGSSSSVFRNSRWLSGLWKANRLEGTVTKVTVGSVFIYWIASAGYGPDSSTPPAEEQSPKNLKLLSCFAHANWQLGDWCLLPSSTPFFSTPLDKGLSKPEICDSENANADFAHTTSQCDTGVIASDESNDNSELMDIDMDAPSSENNENIENSASVGSSFCSSSLSVSKEPVHETWPLHRKKIRKVLIRRGEKKPRKRDENFEKALLIVNTSTRVDVAWQDGKIERGLVSTSLIPIESPGDHEFVAEQYVMEKATDEIDIAGESRRVGVVRSVNARERTACVRWLKPVARAEDPREFDKEEVVSVYELEGHPDYDYCYGDVVVRLSPVSLPARSNSTGSYIGESQQLTAQEKDKQEAKMRTGIQNGEGSSSEELCSEIPDLSWVGNITGLSNGDIEVTWADGMISTVGPQAIYVVGRDDDESITAESEISDVASWETVEDDQMETFQNAKEDSAQQSVSVASSESEESRMVAENSGRNGALSIPLAALGFVTRLATGIFSRGRKHLDPSNMDLRGENDVPDEGNTKFCASEGSGEEFNSQTHNNLDESIVVTDGKELVTREATDLLETAEALGNLKPQEANAPEGYADDSSSFKGFDIAKNPCDHYFIGANGQNNAGRKWLKKVQQDWNILQNNLPDGINVRVYEDRMDLLRAVIVGAYGTPYQDGLFFFDFHLPLEYPDVPPLAYYHSGGWRINPNLYEEGKVCLSLLNTWTGRGNEIWDPSSSSILQVLVSLQGLVLNAKPYFNEAGYDKQIGTAEGEKNSLSYNENTFLLNCKTMMYLMRRPPKDFEGLVREHFRRRGYYILKACDAYMKGYLVGSLTKDASISEKSTADSNSVGFKLMLAKIVPKLFSVLNEVGAHCEEFKHLQ